MECGEREFAWQDADWPALRWDAAAILGSLAEARHREGLFQGRLRALGFELRLEAELVATTEDVLGTSEIEGVRFDAASVRSSVARRLGLPDAALAPSDRRVEAFVEMTLDAMRRHDAKLDADRLHAWHAAIFPTARSGLAGLAVGRWRDDTDGPMQVVSGPYGRRRVHFEAPPAARVDAEMRAFLAWFDASRTGLEGLLRSAIAHLWFLTIHPYEDGNGRIARTIADFALAQAEGSGQRFFSMSARIQRERSGYYAAVESAQRGGLDVTAWILWYLGCFTRALDDSAQAVAAVLAKAAFWQRFASEPLSPRQRAVLNRFLDDSAGPLTARRWATLAKCSVDTAQRDLADLSDRGMIMRNPGGSKRTSYSVGVVTSESPKR